MHMLKHRHSKFPAPKQSWRKKIYEIIYEAETPAGKAFDVGLIICILLSVLVVMMDSVDSLNLKYGHFFYALEWIFTILFTIEYVLRIISIGKPIKYITSFFGIVDLFSIIPTYLGALFPSARYLLVIRILRVLRVFRIFKLAQFIVEGNMLMEALKSSGRKILVFLAGVLALVTIMGSLMYVVEGLEGANEKFADIPTSIYWSIVTITTVGYGDVTPVTILGKFLASIFMIIGYGIIAVPTGIVTVEMRKSFAKNITTEACSSCSREGHDRDALYCKYCGISLNESKLG